MKNIENILSVWLLSNETAKASCEAFIKNYSDDSTLVYELAKHFESLLREYCSQGTDNLLISELLTHSINTMNFEMIAFNYLF